MLLTETGLHWLLVILIGNATSPHRWSWIAKVVVTLALKQNILLVINQFTKIKWDLKNVEHSNNTITESILKESKVKRWKLGM